MRPRSLLVNINIPWKLNSTIYIYIGICKMQINKTDCLLDNVSGYSVPEYLMILFLVESFGEDKRLSWELC